jgi:hypothetical protein
MPAFCVIAHRPAVDKNFMASTLSAVSLLAGGMGSQTVAMEATVAAMKKSNDVAKQEGEALVQLIESSIPQTDNRLLDTYA